MRHLATLLCALLIGLAASTAYAEDAPVTNDRKSAVEQLQPEELEAIKQRLPKAWSAYSAEQQERIARGVLRLRNMSAEQRAKFQERMDQALAAKRAGVNLNKKFDAMRKHRGRFDAAWKIGKGTGQLIRESLGDETTQKLAALPIRVHGRHLDMAFSRMFIETVISAAQQGVMAVDPATLPERLRKQFQAKQRKIASLPADKAERYKRHLAHIVVTAQVMQMLEGVERPAHLSREALRDLDAAERKARMQAHREAHEVYFRAIGEKARARWPEAFDKTVATIRELADDPDKIGRIITRHGRGGGRDSRSRMGGNPVMQVLLMERYFKGLPSESTLRGHTAAIIRGLLIEKAKADPKDVDTALALEGRERWGALLKLARPLSDGRGAARPGGKGWPGRGNGRPGGGRKRGGDPGGNQDERDK